MSLRALSARAVERDAPSVLPPGAAAAPPPAGAAAAPPAPAAGGIVFRRTPVVAQAVATLTTSPTGVTGARATVQTGTSGISAAVGVLTDAIPTEVLAPYTVLVAIFTANASTTDTYTALRWWTFGVAVALVSVYLVVTFAFTTGRGNGRAIPFAEMLAGTAALAAWGLAMPGSPLKISLTGKEFTIATAMVAVGGAFVITLLSPVLSKKSSKAPAT
ncbi:MAG: hypothetical protein ACRDZR_07460 [Acidimicrobiales bacterium]